MRQELIADGHVRGVRLSTGEVLRAVVVGVAPAPQWLKTSGIVLDPRDGGIVCDEYLQSSLPGVYAAGGVALWPNGVFEGDDTVRLENWTNAMTQATHAAENAVRPDRRRPYETVPYFWSDWYGQRIQFVGTADADDVSVVGGGPDEDSDCLVALYRRSDRLVGVATLNEPRKIMEYRRIIVKRDLWSATETAVPV
ncbi:oxidoreductase C-terminal domain-containing protein [Streptomyces sp. NPDC005820]|uniref:oxidoreductase C-terminal domain-containing protein n=1 Tax=Streptomyces sp. NPDC005820 TaxID=3157069 RepID=UPI0033C9D455